MDEDLLEDIIVQLLHISHWTLAFCRLSKIQATPSRCHSGHRIETKQCPYLVQVLFDHYQTAFETWE